MVGDVKLTGQNQIQQAGFGQAASAPVDRGAALGEIATQMAGDTVPTVAVRTGTAEHPPLDQHKSAGRQAAVQSFVQNQQSARTDRE